MKKQTSIIGKGKEVKKNNFSKLILSPKAQAKIKGGGSPWIDEGY